MQFDNLNSVLLLGLVLVCVVPLIIVAVAAVLLLTVGRRAFNEFLNPDVSLLHRHYQRLRETDPRATQGQLLDRVIRRQAFRSGVVGAITGLGGFVTLPIALPVDVLLSLRMQAALVDFIAHAYGHGDAGDRERQVRAYLIMSGGGRVSEAAFTAVMKFLLRVIGKSFSKLIPLIGAAVSFALNYAIVMGMGRVAIGWYSNRAPTLSPGSAIQR